MSDETSEMLAVLNEQLAIKETSGRVVLQVALLATVYFEDAYKLEVREAIVSCCEAYARRCGQHLRWAMNADIGFMEPFSSGKGSDPRSWLLAMPEDEPFGIIWHGAEHTDGVSGFSLFVSGAERRPFVELGYLQFSFPLLWLAEHPNVLQEALLEVCQTIKPVSGYGGVGVIESYNSSVFSKYAPVVFYWSQRLPGLEVDYPSSHSDWLRKGREDGRGGIKGVNWLTVISDRYLAELGGADVVAARVTALDPRFIIHRFDGGVMIQAGPRPSLGDAERGVWPELYVKLARYLKPIRITEHRMFQYGGPGERFDWERSKAWLRRFDGR